MARERGPRENPVGQGQQDPIEINQNGESLLFSPRLKSLAAMAGWDEESILIASLIVEDTPDRQFKHKRRSDLHFKTPPSNNSRKRKALRKSPISIDIPVIGFDEDVSEKQENQKGKSPLPKLEQKEESKREGNEKSVASCSNSSFPCLDKLREELSCAICLEICFEPSTTSCGHSFCKKCLRSAADKCGKKCPKCRQLIGNGRSCTVNTVLWNTIQLLFPQEVEARKASGVLNARETNGKTPETRITTESRNRAIHPSAVSISSRDVTARRREATSEDEDIPPLAQRLLQRDDLSRSLSRREGLSVDEDARLARRLDRQDRLSRMLKRREGQSGDEDARLAQRLLQRDESQSFSRREGPSVDEDARLAQRLDRHEMLSRLLKRKERQNGDEDAPLAQRLLPSVDEDARVAQRLDRQERLSRLLKRRRGITMPNQDEDAALALRLQREEFMEAFRGTTANERSGTSSSLSNS